MSQPFYSNQQSDFTILSIQEGYITQSAAEKYSKETTKLNCYPFSANPAFYFCTIQHHLLVIPSFSASSSIGLTRLPSFCYPSTGIYEQ